MVHGMYDFGFVYVIRRWALGVLCYECCVSVRLICLYFFPLYKSVFSFNR